MKKIFFAAAACLMFFGCTEEQQKPDVQTPDSITVTPESATFDKDGGTADVIVTSTGDWTLAAAEEYAWVEASASTGVDGDIVTFTVAPNLEEDRQGTFTFTTGENTTATFKVFSYAGEAPELTLVSDASVEYGYEAEQLEIVVSTNQNHYRDVKYSLSEGAAEWLSYQATLPGETESDAKLYFNVAALEGLADREATITVSVDGLTPVTVDVLQLAKHVLYTDKAFYTLATEGETVNIPLYANVAYEIAMEGGDDWLTYGEATADGIPFTAAALAEGKRSATVTFTQTDAEEGEEPLSATIKITQVNALVHWAAEMTGNRLFPKWDGPEGGIGSVSTFTLECLLKFNDFDKSAGSLMTIMGIEGTFLLRTGDGNNPLNRLQLATICGNEDAMYHFEANTWYHLALVWENRIAKLYIDGELVHTSQQFDERKYVWWPTYGYVYLDPLNLSPTWSYEPDGNRAFWMGYAYDANRDMHGLMTEIRIWNKALTAEEINAKDHFYTVDPQSEGLFSYWKFVEGEGATVADATGRGNTLYGELDIAKDPETDANKGPEGIDWVEVALPDR